MSLAKRFPLLSMTVGASSLLAAACSSSATSTGVSAGTSRGNAQVAAAALDAPNGGLDLTSKESPAFGDPEVEALPVMATPAGQPLSPATGGASAESASVGSIPYRILLVWGHVPPPNDATSTDVAAQSAEWTGSASVASGAVTLIRTVAFDSGDQVAASAQTVSFNSQTDAYVDGLLLRVLVPQGAAPTLHFATGPVTADIDLSKLASSPGGIARAADGVSGLGWIGFPEDQCTRGFVLGRWIKDQPGLGRALAVVSDSDGTLVGYVRGAWGYAPGRSDEVWFDKYIDTAGNPKGLSSGSYGDGAYSGLWAASDETDESALNVGPSEGFYSDADDTGDGRGVWLGRWSAACVK